MKIFVDHQLIVWREFIDSECYIESQTSKGFEHDVCIILPENYNSINAKAARIIVSSYDLLDYIKKDQILEKDIIATNYSTSNFSLINKNDDKAQTIVICIVKTLDKTYILYDEKINDCHINPNQSIKKIIINYEEGAFCYEKLSYFDKRNIRRYQNKIINIASDLSNKPLISIWKYPYHYKNVINLRVDVDPDRSVSEDKALRRINKTINLLRSYSDRVTMALNFYRRVPNYTEFLRSFTDTFDIANHGFFHHNFIDKYHLNKNITLAESFSFFKKRKVSGYISPEYFWNRNLPSIVSKKGYSYTSSLGYDYCSYPYRSVTPDSVKQYFEIPTNPLVFGKFQQHYGDNINLILKSYADMVVNSSLNSQEPCLLYEHPAIIGEYPDVVNRLFDTAKACGFYPVTLSYFSDWLLRRIKISRQIMCNDDVGIVNINELCNDTNEFSISYRAPNCKNVEIYRLNDVVGTKFSLCSPVMTTCNELDDYNIGSTISYDDEKIISTFSNYKHFMKIFNAYLLFYKYLFLKKYPKH
jgi:hypothetical protein